MKTWLTLLFSGFAVLGLLTAGCEQLTQQNTLLQSSWHTYANRFVQGDGRVIDFKAGHITTSEGQSYGLMRALWTRDRSRFDQIYHWSVNNLQTRGDKLFSWQWGPRKDGSWGVMDKTAASDADQDIAFALLMAYKAWGDDRYRTEALAILNDLWRLETVQTPIGRVMLPGDWPRSDPKAEYQINPSYFAPYAYRVFAEADKAHPWADLISTSYKITGEAAAMTRTRLVPDWVALSPQTGTIRLYTEDARSDFGYEAIRTYWRFAVDRLISPEDARPAPWLNHLGILSRYWELQHGFPGPLTPTGQPRKVLDSDAIYGAMLPALIPKHGGLSMDVVQFKVLPGLRDAHIQKTEDYYAQNWLWFGLAAAWKHPAGKTPTQRLLNLMTL